MKRYAAYAPSIAGFLVAAVLIGAAQTDVARLRFGDEFPRISGPTVAGRPLELPAAAAGKPVVLIFSFSRAAGKDAHSWNERLSRDFPDSVPGYEVIVLESVPKLVRGMAMSGIRGSMASSMQKRAMVLYQDEKLWKRRLAVSNDSRAYIVLLGADGLIRWSNAGAFAEPEYAHLKSEIENLQPHSGA